MQTFLTHSDFAQTALHLDNRRLGKQRVETLQILNALRLPNYGWKNHPAVKMWAGHELVLANYGIAMCKEWIRRGFNDTCEQKLSAIAQDIFYGTPSSNGVPPWWVNDARVHISHQSNLIRKQPEHYRKLFPNVPDDLPYFWPSHHQKEAA